MGFFRFKKGAKEGLDIPPVFPAEELPSLEEEFPSLPEMPPAPASSPELEEELPPPETSPRFPPLELVEPEEKLEMPELEERPIPIPKEVAKAGGPIYIEVDKYREILNGISSIKDSIKAADNALERLNELKNSREKEIERWHNSMDGIQKKLSFIDKSLFKGG